MSDAVTIIEGTTLTLQHRQAIYELWNKEYPTNLRYNDISELDAYLNNLTEARHYFLTYKYGEVLGWAFTFVRDGEKWFAIIVDSAVQGKGYGGMMLDRIKERKTKLNGWVIDHDRYVKEDGSPYKAPLAFYLKNGFVTIPDVRLEIEKLSAIKIEWRR
jgi:GNAT superfamily N-acetyltransferase